MPQAWSRKRERQYEHIKDSLEERGQPEKKAEEIAARTVNKERARAGESATASRTSVDDISSSRRGGLRSHSGAGGRMRDQLYAEAQRKGIEGRSKMNKAELARALGRCRPIFAAAARRAGVSCRLPDADAKICGRRRTS